MSVPVRSGGTAQLDLFVDGAETVLLHALGEALAAGRPEAAHEALARLRRHDPAHPDLLALGRLCETVRPGLPPPDSPGSLGTLVREIETVLLPAAERLLGPSAPAALRPVWRRVAEGAARVGLDGVDEAEGGGHVRFWVGAAHHHLGRRRQALRLWLSLAWRDSLALTTLAARCPDDTLRLAWIAFERGPGFDVPEEPAAAARWFPAWVFLQDRELAGLFGVHEIGGPAADPAEAAARAVVALLPLETRGLSEEVVSGRRALKAAAPAFFRHYLRRVGR
jgi:hypothetical protein